MLFSEDESKVTLIDYQQMALVHPARDFWHFLSATTDAEFRRAHLTSLVLCPNFFTKWTFPEIFSIIVLLVNGIQAEIKFETSIFKFKI